MAKSRQQILKLSKKECFFCGNSDYEVLDVHRLIPGSDGGTYGSEANTLVSCALCHRYIHSGKIVVDKKYHWSGPGYIVRYWKDGEEFWKKE